MLTVASTQRKNHHNTTAEDITFPLEETATVNSTLLPTDGPPSPATLADFGRERQQAVYVCRLACLRWLPWPHRPSRSQVLSSIVQVTGASAMSDERTLQYLVTDSSTARAAFCTVMAAGPCSVKCRTAEASRRGI